MKSFLLSSLFCVLSLPFAIANNTVPEAALKVFQQLFPKIESPFWENRQEAVVATFRDDEGLKKVFFTPEGQWQETRLRVYLSELPRGVRSFIDAHYQEAEITYLGLVQATGSVHYRVESEFADRIVLKKLDKQGILLEEEIIWLSLSDDQM